MAKAMIASEEHEDCVIFKVSCRIAHILIQGVAGLTGTGGIVGLCWLDIAHCSLTEWRGMEGTEKSQQQQEGLNGRHAFLIHSATMGLVVQTLSYRLQATESNCIDKIRV